MNKPTKVELDNDVEVTLYYGKREEPHTFETKDEAVLFFTKCVALL